MYKSHNRNATKDTILISIAILFFVAIPIQLAIWHIKSSPTAISPVEIIENAQKVHTKKGTPSLNLLTSYGFDISRIRKNDMAVPKVYFAKMPHQLSNVKDVKTKKKVFFASLLPSILKVNDTIRHDRRKLKTIIIQTSSDNDISESDYQWLSQKMVQYRVSATDKNDFLSRKEEILNELLSKINIIPPELALAQAVQESGWGTSRFAQVGNAIFGQWTWGDGCGMTPLGRDEDKDHQIKCFDTIMESVDSYMLNINTNDAYQALRDERQNFPDDREIKTMSLVDTLVNYSEEGIQYVNKIKDIIRTNKLYDFKHAKLAEK